MMYFNAKKTQMDKFRYWVEWDKCRQGIGWKETCWKCSFELLCLFQQNQERIWSDIHEAKKTSDI